MIEIWKDIKDYEDLYTISNYGKIKRKKDNYIFKENKNSRGYRVITLTKNKIEKSYSVHRLVAETFIPNIYNLPQINHKDGNKMNNKVNNLEWCNQSYNMKHAYKNGLEIKKCKKVNQYDLDNNLIMTWNSVKEASKKLGIKSQKIYLVCNSKRNKAGNYIWRYVNE